MREIKFRIWDKYRIYMSYDSGYLIDTRGDLWFFNRGILERQDLSKFEITQYTGLKDCRGKEIYEEDILRSDSGEGFYLSKVVYKLGAFYAVNSQNEDLLSEIIDEDFIVGNTFENPEILVL